LIIGIGCGCVSGAKYMNSGLGLTGIALTWGSVVSLAVYATRDVSGAHLNPAITASLLVNKPDALPLTHAPYYIASQLIGATGGAAVNYLLFRNAISAYEKKAGFLRGTAASASVYDAAFGLLPNTAALRTGGAFAAEVVATGAFAYLIYAVTDSNSTVPAAAAPALIGAAVAALVAAFGPITGCGMNPARDLGPRLVTAMAGWRGAAFQSAWAYTAGPVTGAILGGALYQYLNSPRKSAAANALP
jgi:MIP family channel proteins